MSDDRLVIRAGGPADSAALPLYTKMRTFIENQRRRERAPESLAAAARAARGHRPHVVLRSLSATYNCVGMVFASRRTWIDTDQLPRIFGDDGYSRTEAPFPGDVVVYRAAANEITHIGVVIEAREVFSTKQILVLSQWGADGEYLHLQEHVPEWFGRPAEYWTERQEPH